MRYKLTLLLSVSIVAGLAQDITMPENDLALIRQEIQTGDVDVAFEHCSSVSAFASSQLHHAPPSGQVPDPLAASPEVTDLLALVDKSQQALAARDFSGLRDYSMSLGYGLNKAYQRRFPTPSQKLSRLEQRSANLTEFQRFLRLPKLAKMALEAGETDKAASYATEVLAAAATHPGWKAGDAIHQGNIVLGRLALQQGDLKSAKERLLAAGTTKGSPVLDSFGPNMALAKELLTRGERQSVLEYLSECKQFWKLDKGRIDRWSAEIQGGVVPAFGANLVY